MESNIKSIKKIVYGNGQYSKLAIETEDGRTGTLYVTGDSAHKRFYGDGQLTDDEWMDVTGGSLPR